MNRNTRAGFSVVELLIVIAIIGILSTIVIGSTAASRARARDDARISDLKEIQLGLALYFDVNKRYPVGTDVSVLRTTLVTDKYLPMIPTDPTGGEYEYIGTLTPSKKYCLGARLEIATIPNDRDPNNCTSKTTGSTANYKVTR